METLNKNKESSALETVSTFLEAMNKQDYAQARQYVHNDLKFIGVMGTRDGADAYFRDMEKMKLHYEILKIFAAQDDVAVFYTIRMGDKNIFSSGWYQLEENKIKSFKVLFDPRPLLDQSRHSN